MKLNSPLPHRKARIEIIPLIDIMFFLLASFMLVSMSMIRLAGVKMSLPQASSAQKESKPDFIPISIAPDGNVFWEKEKTPINRDQIQALIKPLYAANKELRIYINADKEALHGSVIDVLDRVRQAGVTKVSFAIKPGASGPAGFPAPDSAAVPGTAPAPGGAPLPPTPPVPPVAPPAPGAPPNP